MEYKMKTVAEEIREAKEADEKVTMEIAKRFSQVIVDETCLYRRPDWHKRVYGGGK